MIQIEGLFFVRSLFFFCTLVVGSWKGSLSNTRLARETLLVYVTMGEEGIL